MSADALFRFIRPHDHGQRIPPHEALDSSLDVRAPWHGHFVLHGNCVCVRRIRRKGKRYAAFGGMNSELVDESRGLRGPAGREHRVKGLEPLTTFDLVQIAGVGVREVPGGTVSHVKTIAEPDYPLIAPLEDKREAIAPPPGARAAGRTGRRLGFARIDPAAHDKGLSRAAIRSQRVQKGQQRTPIGGAEVLEQTFGRRRLIPVPKDGVLSRKRQPVVHEPISRPQAPEWCRPNLVRG